MKIWSHFKYSKMIRAFVSILFLVVLTSCGSGDSKSSGTDETEDANKENKSTITTSISKETENMDDATEKETEELIEDIKSFLMKQMKLNSEDAVTGAARKLVECGCIKAAELKIIDDSDDVYTVELTDQNHKVFCFNIEYDGYIGPIKDDKGEYLYLPLE